MKLVNFFNDEFFILLYDKILFNKSYFNVGFYSKKKFHTIITIPKSFSEILIFFSNFLINIWNKMTKYNILYLRVFAIEFGAR